MKIKILLIEDSDTDQELIGYHLQGKIDCSISSVKTVFEAKKLLLANSYDIILLDLNLPDSSGEETFQQIFSVTSSPIVILTISNNIDLALSLVEKGADNYLFKEDSFNKPDAFANQILFAIKRHFKSIDSVHDDIKSMKKSIDNIKRLL